MVLQQSGRFRPESGCSRPLRTVEYRALSKCDPGGNLIDVSVELSRSEFDAPLSIYLFCVL